MQNRSVSDTQIIQALRAGGTERTRMEYLLYRRHADFVRKRPRKYGLSEEEARDAYTEAFLVVVDQIRQGKFRGDSSLKTYLSRIFRNKCVDQYRKNSTVSVSWVSAFPELPDSSRDFLRSLVDQESLQRLQGLMKQLSERCQQVLMLAGQGYKPLELAAHFGFKSGHSASSQRYKCLEKLKKLIKQRQALNL